MKNADLPPYQQTDEFTQAVNEGYSMAKNNPAHFEIVLFEAEQDNPERYRGYSWGKWLHEQEQLNDIKGLRQHRKNKEQELEFGF